MDICKCGEKCATDAEHGRKRHPANVYVAVKCEDCGASICDSCAAFSYEDGYICNDCYYGHKEAVS